MGVVESNGCVIRGLNCPHFGHRQVRNKVRAAVEWLDRNGHREITASVAIDRSALLMLEEEFAQLDALRGERDRLSELLADRSADRVEPMPEAEPAEEADRSMTHAFSLARDLVDAVPVGLEFTLTISPEVVSIKVDRP